MPRSKKLTPGDAHDAKELNAPPLRLGMLLHVEVDMHERSGAATHPKRP